MHVFDDYSNKLQLNNFGFTAINIVGVFFHLNLRLKLFNLIKLTKDFFSCARTLNNFS